MQLLQHIQLYGPAAAAAADDDTKLHCKQRKRCGRNREIEESEEFYEYSPV